MSSIPRSSAPHFLATSAAAAGPPASAVNTSKLCATCSTLEFNRRRRYASPPWGQGCSTDFARSLDFPSLKSNADRWVFGIPCWSCFLLFFFSFLFVLFFLVVFV